MTYVSVKLMGGLGNQLFEIFTTLAYALKYDLEFKFQDSDILTIGIHHRPTYWNTLLSELKPFLVPVHTLTNNIYNEWTFRYIELPVFKESTTLFGYYQSYKYFENHIDIIMQLLSINAQIISIKKQFAYLFDSSKEVVSMHFRITGYREIEHCHPVAKYEYYINALRNFKDARILYLCQPEDQEEVNLIIEKLKNEFPLFDFIKIPNELQDWQQMLLTACCNSNIIANSSFSWWGAYFGQTINNNAGRVYYPLKWFGPGLNKDISDMSPPTWIGIN